jgi:hypothetical protein
MESNPKKSDIAKLTLGDLVLSVLPWPFHKDLPSTADGERQRYTIKEILCWLICRKVPLKKFKKDPPFLSDD